MSPKKLTTKPADKAWATGRRRVAEKYYEVAGMLEHDNGLAINVCVGLCVLAGIAAADAICAAATGERYSGPDHMAAVELLERVDRECGKRLRALAALKPPAHYGTGLLADKDRVGALRDATYLISEAARRTGGSAPGVGEDGRTAAVRQAVTTPRHGNAAMTPRAWAHAMCPVQVRSTRRTSTHPPHLAAEPMSR